jgi:hypothetical protein
MVITKGIKHYSIDPDKLEEARSIVNQELVLQPQTDKIVQQYSGELKGYTFWKEEFDTD